jgi:hypothetical protein
MIPHYAEKRTKERIKANEKRKHALLIGYCQVGGWVFFRVVPTGYMADTLQAHGSSITTAPTKIASRHRAVSEFRGILDALETQVLRLRLAKERAKLRS